ncbi:MAG: Formate hydrogenlyase transcriptional activator [Bryobacterales bacterium]|nr:Formate hydrogenlyase transcriptional activator [Bryobacterales bacterium]
MGLHTARGLNRWAKSAEAETLQAGRLNIGPRLILGFAVIIFSMLAADAVVLWQFHLVRTEAEHLNGIDQKLVAVLRVHTSLSAFHDRLEALVDSQDARRLVIEAGPLRTAVLEDSRRAMSALSLAPFDLQRDPTILPTLQAVRSALPSQLEAITTLATSGDWRAVRLRLANQVTPLKSLTEALVETVDHEVGEEQARTVRNIKRVQRLVFLVVPVTTVFTLLIAATLGLAITRSITQPLARLVEGAKALARGEFQHQVSVTGNDELAHLGRVFNDTARRLRDLYATLQSSEDRLRLVIDTIPAHVWSTVPDGSVDFINQRWLQSTGLSVEGGMGWNWDSALHPDDRARFIEEWRSAVAAGEPMETEARLRQADGGHRWSLIRNVPLRDDLGNIVKWYGTSIDIEDRKQAEDALRHSQAYLSEAQRLSLTGSFGWKVSTGEILWSAETFRIFQYDRATKPSLDLAFQRTHPEDALIVKQTVARASQNGNNFDFEHRLLMPDGSVKYVHVVARGERDESGELKFLGAVMDVTAAKQSQQALEQAFREIKTLKDQLQSENIVLREEIDRASMFEEIVGSSAALQAVLSRVSKVAPTDSSVLVTGETGTGKELFARAIHRRSQRSSRAFVSVNCAAIPRDLIASELFGHEKGAFTGAIQRRFGRFELAEGGTIFLDEIGELPAETQIALLRVLQEHEFERVGGTGSIRTDVRVIAATNRDLQAAIAEGTFRSDLFYRLNVFPIEVPALRERKEDIPMLVEYFIDRYARKAGKSFQAVNKKSLDLLQAYPWPGNIRELQNVVERSVVVCETENFSVDESWLSRQSVASEPKSQLELSQKLAAQEKEMIEAALRESGGRVSGPSGAAAKLGIPGSTLESKIKSLKINKNRFKTADRSTTRA